MDSASLTIIAFIFLLAGFVKGGIGVGLPTVSVGLLALVMPPAQAAALLVLPSLLTNVWQMLAGPFLPSLLRRLWPMLLAMALATIAAGNLLTAAARGPATAAVGAVLIAYGALGLSGIRLALPRRAEVWVGPAAGIATGIVSAMTSIFVLPAMPYYQAIGLEKDEMVQMLGLSFFVSTVAIAIALTRNGLFSTDIAAPSLVALAAAAAGMAVGQFARSRISAAAFRLFFYIGMLGLGTHLMLRVVW